MSENTRKWYGIAAGLLVIVVALGWYFAHTKKAVAPVVGDMATTTSATSTGTGAVQVTGIPDNSGIKAPDLNRPYTPLSSLPQSIQDNNKKLVATAVAQLKFNPGAIAYWLQLAGLRKGANDFVGAEEIWLFVTKRWPTDPISYNNLADLYENYLHDYTKATVYWNQLIKLSPTNISAYLNLATMYNINLKDKADAKATLEAGLKANPNNPDLQYALDHLQ